MGTDSALFPGDFPLDVMLHPSAVRGEEGLAAMQALVRVYMEQHGMAIHFNVFDAETLIDAQERHERHQSLQVRMAGWNACFTELRRKEQDTYIRRARNMAR